VSPLFPDLPNVAADLFERPDRAHFSRVASSTHRPRILLLYGSLRVRSFSKLLTLEAARLLTALGAETRIYDPSGLPLPDSIGQSGPREWSGARRSAMARWPES